MWEPRGKVRKEKKCQKRNYSSLFLLNFDYFPGDIGKGVASPLSLNLFPFSLDGNSSFQLWLRVENATFRWKEYGTVGEGGREIPVCRVLVIY